jgi:Domain of unknown function (DUF4105)
MGDETSENVGELKTEIVVKEDNREKLEAVSWSRRLLYILLKCILGVVIFIFSFWCFGVVIYLFPWLPTFFAWVFVTLIFACAVGYFFGKFRRPALITAGTLYALVLILWFSIQPSNDQEWQPPWGKMPSAEFNGNKVTVSNIRDFIYRSENDYTPNYITETYDLDEINDLSLITSFWDGNKLICHMMLDFGFKNGNRVVVSVETRLPKGKKQTSIGGLFKQYEVLAIFGTRSDLLMLRTNYRKEEVFMYQTTSGPKDVRKLFVSLLKAINRLKKRSAFYNTITTNCTTSLVPFIRTIRPGKGWSLKLLLNGLSPEMAFENGWFKRLPGEDFASCRIRSHISPIMQSCNDRNQYSKILNEKFTKQLKRAD